MLEQIVFVVHHRTLPSDEQDALAVVQQPHLVRGHKVAPGLLVVDAVTAAAPLTLVIAGRGDGLLTQQFRNIFVGFLFGAAEVEELIAQTDERFPIVLVHSFELRHVLHDDGAENSAGTHGGQRRQECIFRQGNVRVLIHQAMHRHRQASFVYTIRLAVQRLNKLRVDHANEVIQRLIRIGDAAEQRDFAFAQFLQVQLVRHRQLGDGRQIECSQAYTHADQNGLRGFARDKLSRTF